MSINMPWLRFVMSINMPWLSICDVIKYALAKQSFSWKGFLGKQVKQHLPTCDLLTAPQMYVHTVLSDLRSWRPRNSCTTWHIIKGLMQKALLVHNPSQWLNYVNDWSTKWINTLDRSSPIFFITAQLPRGSEIGKKGLYTFQTRCY